jgi:hypothetical protein
MALLCDHLRPGSVGFATRSPSSRKMWIEWQMVAQWSSMQWIENLRVLISGPCFGFNAGPSCLPVRSLWLHLWCTVCEHKLEWNGSIIYLVKEPSNLISQFESLMGTHSHSRDTVAWWTTNNSGFPTFQYVVLSLIPFLWLQCPFFYISKLTQKFPGFRMFP